MHNAIVFHFIWYFSSSVKNSQDYFLPWCIFCVMHWVQQKRKQITSCLIKMSLIYELLQSSQRLKITTTKSTNKIKVFATCSYKKKEQNRELQERKKMKQNDCLQNIKLIKISADRRIWWKINFEEDCNLKH